MIRRRLWVPHGQLPRAGLIEARSPLRPSALSLTHHGVLFREELSEYPGWLLDGLREPRETDALWITRAPGSTCLSTRALLVAAMNP
jgi:magnesium chelatase family protein